jgi:hypothetical protein
MCRWCAHASVFGASVGRGSLYGAVQHIICLLLVVYASASVCLGVPGRAAAQQHISCGVCHSRHVLACMHGLAATLVYTAMAATVRSILVVAQQPIQLLHGNCCLMGDSVDPACLCGPGEHGGCISGS